MQILYAEICNFKITKKFIKLANKAFMVFKKIAIDSGEIIIYSFFLLIYTLLSFAIYHLRYVIDIYGIISIHFITANRYCFLRL